MIVKTLHRIVFCTAEFFDRDYPPTETPSCYAELLPLHPDQITTTTTTPEPEPTSESLVPIPKTLCAGDLSFKTVYGQRCKVNIDKYITFHIYLLIFS